jgi:hypothetical protein
LCPRCSLAHANQLATGNLPCPAGGDDRPHPCIGRARRLMVGHRKQLAERMIEAVQNHGPEVRCHCRG